MKHSYDATNSFDPQFPLYDGRWEHDACGTGFLAHIGGERSHLIVQTALEALARLTHRGAQDADAETYDGAGIMTQIPRELLCEELDARQAGPVDDPADLAVGMFFLPSQERSPEAYEECRHLIEQSLTDVGLVFLGWRNPPIDYTVLGAKARAIAPTIAQVLLMRPAQLPSEHYARTLYYARRLIEGRLHTAQLDECFIVSLSHTTLIYKGLLPPSDLARFYLDLGDPRYTSVIAPIRCHPGPWPSPYGCSPIMARSILYRGIATGCRRARVRLSRRCGMRRSRIFSRSCNPPVATLPSSTTPWNSSITPVAACFIACRCWFLPPGNRIPNWMMRSGRGASITLVSLSPGMVPPPWSLAMVVSLAPLWTAMACGHHAIR